MKDKIAIYLSPEDIMLFKEFQQRYKIFKLLTDKGIFDTKGGSSTIHFNRLGEVVGVEKTEHYVTII